MTDSFIRSYKRTVKYYAEDILDTLKRTAERNDLVEDIFIDDVLKKIRELLAKEERS